MKRTLIIIGGVFGVLIGMGFVVPAIAQWNHEGSMTGVSVALLLLGLMMTLGGIAVAIRVLRQRGV
jgi:hypothetical protein